MRILMTAFVCAALLVAGTARAETPEEQRLNDANEVLTQLAAIPEDGIPPALLGSAEELHHLGRQHGQMDGQAEPGVGLAELLDDEHVLGHTELATADLGRVVEAEEAEPEPGGEGLAVAAGGGGGEPDADLVAVHFDGDGGPGEARGVERVVDGLLHDEF